jgi:hypothetical protein
MAHLCSSYTAQDLILHGDFAFGAEEQFANEAKMAVRLANFISAFLQVGMHRNVVSQYLSLSCDVSATCNEFDGVLDIRSKRSLFWQACG